MDWAPDGIRALATAMEQRLDRPVLPLSPGTARLVIEALRFFALHGFADRREGYTVEVSDHRRGTVGVWVGQVADIGAAELLYGHVVATEPNAHVYIRKGGWVVRHSRPSGPIEPPDPEDLRGGP